VPTVAVGRRAGTVEQVDAPEGTTPVESPRAEAQFARPPEDAESWTDDEWIAWLDATDDPDATDDSHAPRRRHRGRGPTSTLGAAMLGLHEVIYGPHGNEIAIVVDAGGDPPNDDLPEVHLDPEHPERSEVIVRRATTQPPPDHSSSSEST